MTTQPKWVLVGWSFGSAVATFRAGRTLHDGYAVSVAKLLDEAGAQNPDAVVARYVEAVKPLAKSGDWYGIKDLMVEVLVAAGADEAVAEEEAKEFCVEESRGFGPHWTAVQFD